MPFHPPELEAAATGCCRHLSSARNDSASAVEGSAGDVARERVPGDSMNARTSDAGHRPSIPGAALATVAVGLSTRASFVPRSGREQALIAIPAALMGYGLGAGTEALGRRIGDRPADRTKVAGTLAVGGAVATAGLAGAGSWTHMPGAGQALRSVAMLVAAGGAATLAAEQAHEQFGSSGSAAALIGVVALTAGGVMSHRASIVLPQAREVAALRATELRTRGVAESSQVEALLPERVELGTVDTVSGSGASTLGQDELGKLGRKWTASAASPRDIERLNASTDAVSPVRIFVPVPERGGVDAQMQMLVQELRALPALDRKTLIIAPPAAGYPQSHPITAAELLDNGDVATIAVASTTKPSLQSLHKVRAATDVVERTLQTVAQELARRPADSRPERIVLYGESFGSGVLRRVVLRDGAAPLAEHSVDSAILVGSPRIFERRGEAALLGRLAHDASPANGHVSNVVFTTNNDQARLIPTTSPAGQGTTLLVHGATDDAIAWMGPASVLVPPPPLAGRMGSSAVHPGVRFIPGISALHYVNDMRHAITVPGRMHDHRADTPWLMRAALNPQARDETVVAALTYNERADIAREAMT